MNIISGWIRRREEKGEERKGEEEEEEEEYEEEGPGGRVIIGYITLTLLDISIKSGCVRQTLITPRWCRTA